MDKKIETPKNYKEDLLRDENNRMRFNFVAPKPGRYVIGSDPYRRITLWHRFWMFFGLYRSMRNEYTIINLKQR